MWEACSTYSWSEANGVSTWFTMRTLAVLSCPIHDLHPGDLVLWGISKDCHKIFYL